MHCCTPLISCCLGPAIVLLAAVPSNCAGRCLGSDFHIDSAAPLAVSYRGLPMIVGESAQPELAGTADVRPVEVDGWQEVFAVRRADESSGTRAEVAASADAFELTFQRLVKADVAGFVRYSFVVPHEFLDGCQAEIVGSGVSVPGEYVKGRQLAGPLGADEISFVRPILYLRVHHGADAIDFDFNPRGYWTGESTVTPFAAEWNMRRMKEGYVFSTAFSRTIYGTLQEFKLVVRTAGVPALRGSRPVAEVHPYVAARWTVPYRNALRLNFGRARIKGYTSLPATDETRAPARWRDPAAVHMETDDRFRAGETRHEGAAPIEPEHESILEIDAGRPGYYLVNMLVGAPDRAVGPCRISVAGEHRADGPLVPAGNFDSWAVVAKAENDRLALGLLGDFRLAAVSLAPLLYQNEDFLFDRPWWLVPEHRAGGDLLDILAPHHPEEGESPAQ